MQTTFTTTDGKAITCPANDIGAALTYAREHNLMIEAFTVATTASYDPDELAEDFTPDQIFSIHGFHTLTEHEAIEAAWRANHGLTY